MFLFLWSLENLLYTSKLHQLQDCCLWIVCCSYNFTTIHNEINMFNSKKGKKKKKKSKQCLSWQRNIKFHFPNSELCDVVLWLYVFVLWFVVRSVTLPWAERDVTNPRLGLEARSNAKGEVIHILRYHGISRVFIMDFVPGQEASFCFCPWMALKLLLDEHISPFLITTIKVSNYKMCLE